MRLYLSSFGLGNRPEELIALLRGGKRAGVVLNAKDGSSAESRARSLAEEIENLTRLGLHAVELDLRTYFEDQQGLRQRLAELDLLWVRGGNTFVLRRAFRQSGADEILPEFVGHDALVYGGFSAGAAVLTPSLQGLELVDDPSGVPDGYLAEAIWEGLNLLPYAVAPHYRSDHPESAAVDALVDHFVGRHVLFRALRDGEAIVVDGDRHDVVS